MGDKKRTYQLLCSEPQTEFDGSILRFLQNWPGEKLPKSYVILAIPEDNDVDEAGMVLYSWRTTLDDLLRAKGHLDLEIHHESILENLDTYFQAGAQEGLLPCQQPQGYQYEDEDDAEEADTDGDET